MVDNTEVVRRGYESFAAGDIPAVVAIMDPDVEWYEAENSLYWTGRPLVGPQQVVEQVFARIQEDFDDFAIDLQRVVGCGDVVLVQTRYAGRCRATGAVMDVQAAHVWDLRDGRLVRFQQYVDTWQLATVTERTPEPA